jgi:hypothetical protein
MSPRCLKQLSELWLDLCPTEVKRSVCKRPEIVSNFLDLKGFGGKEEKDYKVICSLWQTWRDKVEVMYDSVSDFVYDFVYDLQGRRMWIQLFI